LPKTEDYDIILVGQETSDSGTGNVGPHLAGLLGLPLVSNVVELETNRDGTIRMEREVEDGRHVISVRSPVVICALTGLNEPRYPSLKGIMAARRKPVEEKQIGNFSLADASSPGVLSGRKNAQLRALSLTMNPKPLRSRLLRCSRSAT
jgi:electron transfer flavoprotein beta subunit